MTFGILQSRTLHPSILTDEKFSQRYILFGEFYEDKTNARGGVDYLCKDLDTFLSSHKEGEEYGQVKNYADRIAAIQGISIPLPHRSRKKYILKNYDRYQFYVQMQK